MKYAVFEKRQGKKKKVSETFNYLIDANEHLHKIVVQGSRIDDDSFLCERNGEKYVLCVCRL